MLVRRLRCVICDDNRESAETAKNKAEKVFRMKNIRYEIIVYTSSKQMLFELDGSQHIDLVILDIQMPSVSGLKIAEEIKKFNKTCHIIFLSSYINYAVDGYELEVFRFIPKSDIERRLGRAISDAVDIIEAEENQCYLIQKRNMSCKIMYCDILYITKCDKNSVFHCKNNQVFTVRKPLRRVFSELDSECFIYSDRGCIVNISNAVRIERAELTCNNGDRLPISRSSYANVKKRFINYLVERV